MCLGLYLAEGVGFEPTDGRPSTVFKTVALSRSATPPRSGRIIATLFPTVNHPSNQLAIFATKARNLVHLWIGVSLSA